MQLDIEVSRLEVLKAGYQSEYFALEDKITKDLPVQLKNTEERIAGYVADITVHEQHKPAKEKDGKSRFAGMTVNGTLYTDKEKAGDALLQACEGMINEEPSLIGEYIGFPMELAILKQYTEFAITLKGQLSHTAYLGTDKIGNITRLNNVLENMSNHLEAENIELNGLKKELENA